ncbi:hypothetical protein KCU81_g4468, partial [Aureobasidium melanogenum]|uniref:Uncharacterized protein n=1 Tax=Aureobasidium melanogenum (strain CBS 110374) TaxID=1043003 RepID=A0A074W8L7_AURM1
MKFFTVATVYLVAGLAHGAALSEKVLASAHSQIMGNASSVLGWQVAGSQQSLAPVDQGCQNISSFGHGHWAALGLKPAVIEQAFCVATARVSNSSALSLSQIKLAATDIFVAQLLNAFGDDTESSYEWLCQNFDYTAINDKLALDSGRVGQAFCANRPYATAWVNPSHDVLVVADSSIYNMASALFATLFSFSASTVTQRWVMCEQYFYMSQAQLQEGINSTIVRSALCLDHDEPLMTLDYSQNLITDLSTEIFARQLALAVNAVNDEEKQAWLCENIQHGDLGLLGMTANNTLFC